MNATNTLFRLISYWPFIVNEGWYGELEFVLPADKVVRLHGTEWAETQRFHHHLNTRWQQWSREMSVIAAQVLQQVLDDIALSNTQQKWLTRQQTTGLQQKSPVR